MNKKGKNKKGKVPNPIPQEEKTGGDKTEDLEVIGDTSDLGKTSEITENVVEKNDSVKEERVPEIVSAVVTQPVDKKDEETPKKPKRNRGKKKKGKDDDFDDNIEEGQTESSGPVPEETKADNLKVEKELSDVAPVTPTARKKKNKKKSGDQTVEENITPDAEHTVPTPKDIKESEVTDIKETVTTKADPEPIEQEVKPPKKKNKKKKRNDSERSEKEEISCTTAFQKLIDAKDESLEANAEEISSENVTPLDNVKAESENQLLKDTHIQKTEIEKDVVLPVEATLDITEEHQRISAQEGKNKKKNKKDKKPLPKPEVTVPLPTEHLTDIPPSLLDIEKEASFSSIIKEEVSKDTLSLDEAEPESKAEKTSPKPKAKIAKPVEKKRKDKQDNQPLEIPIQKVANEPSKTEELPSSVKLVLESPEAEVVEKETISNIEPKKSEQEIPMEMFSLTASSLDEKKELNVEEYEPLNITDRVTKKRKKGAKISKTPDVSFEISEIKPEICAEIKKCTVDIKPTEISQEPIAKDLQILTKEEQDKATSEIKEAPVAPEAPRMVATPEDLKPIIELPIQPGIHDHVLVTPEISEEKERVKTESLMPEMVEEILKFETKASNASKKCKKSPKPQRKNQPIQKTDEILTQETKTIAENVQQSDMGQEMSKKIEASNITKMYDIEISSIKTDESAGSICDTVPDITYPRCSSQQLPEDKNNNTFIREIFPLQATSPDTVIRDCIKFPKTEEITELKKEASPSKEEKTDLKSKMMEVNQDMEELRLSIERSLAELTSMEKSEEVIDKQFDVSKMKSKDNLTAMSDLTQKKIEPEKNVQVSEADKCCVEKPVDTPKTFDIAQDKKQIEDLLFSLDIKQPKKCEEVQKDCSTLKCEKTEIKSPEIPAQGVKNTTPMPMTVEEKLTDTLIKSEDKIASVMQEKTKNKTASGPVTLIVENKPEQPLVEKQGEEEKSKQAETQSDAPPVCPARKDNKNKQKKKKGKQDSQAISTATTQSTAQSTTQSTTQEKKKEKKADSKSENKGDSKGTQEKGKQQADNLDQATEKDFSDMDYEPIENFEDALTSSADDVNKTFELIVKESQDQTNPKINIIAPDEEKTPVAPSKNLLGHPDIPVPSNKRDYKKEKDKIPNDINAEVNIKDATDVERKQSKNTQTIFKLKDMKDCKLSDNEEFVYKYNFRRVFLQSGCHVCNKDVAGARVPCCYCNLVFYCGIKHKDEDWVQHQALCFAVSTIAHLKDQKHIYADTKNITGHDYRLIRMQMIVSCEKVLKRRLVPWEQEALLYPRLCAHVPCREWRQNKLSDCQGCGQISFCTENPDHYPKSHSRWCKSYSLYQKLVSYQQTKGRLEPRLPTKVMQGQYEIPEKINEVLAGMYEEKIDMNDIQYAALTQLATAPLSAAYCYQLCKSKNATANGYKKSSFTIHVVGAELQFEADALNKWEVFFLHLRPELQELKVVLINYNLNPSNLPLELLGKIKLCEHCRQNRRRVILSFQDKRTYGDYKSSDDFVVPDIVCAFNPSIQRSSIYNGKDPWPSTINVILKQKIPFLLTSYTMTELHKDCIRIKECSETGYNAISEPKYNNFASVRPDRNFISDDEMPLLFKNYCFAIICG